MKDNFSEKKLNRSENLSNLNIGERGLVTKVLGKGPSRSRLFHLGITPGTEIIIKKFAPLGDPIEILLRGYKLSIRKKEAESIEIERRV